MQSDSKDQVLSEINPEDQGSGGRPECVEDTEPQSTNNATEEARSGVSREGGVARRNIWWHHEGQG